MPYSKLHAAARAYAEFGWPVFPVHVGEKTPACNNGYLDATTDLEQIDQWWSVADYNIGFCPENAGICVVDEDTDKGGKYNGVAVENTARNDKGIGKTAADGYLVKTPHGKHFYYAGSLPPTANRIGPFVDTRGKGSYVLLPPSCAGNVEYVATAGTPFPCSDFDLPEVPQWIIERCQSDARPRNRVVVDEDRPAAIAAFKRYLKDKEPVGEDECGDDYAVACRALDLGLTLETFMVIIEEHGGDPEYGERNYINAENYAQNEPGCDTPLTPTETHAKLIQGTSQERDQATRRQRTRNDRRLATEGSGGPSVQGQPGAEAISRFESYEPRDRSELPEIGYFDNDHFIPNGPDGSIGILYGKRGDHKTNTILSMLSSSSAQRLLYVAGEGSFGVERDRIPAHPDLKGRIRIVPAMPRLGDPSEVEEFITVNDQYGPFDIVVLDTLATALAGEEENSAMTAAMLTDNGTCGMIKHAWGSTVIIVAHSGKDAKRGVRGTSAFEGNTDFLIEVVADKKTGTIVTTLVKMRDGYDGMVTHWKYENSANAIPVPERISETEYRELTSEETKEESSPVSLAVRSFLRLDAHTTWVTGIETLELATELTVQEHGCRPDDPDEAADWDTARNRWRKALHGSRNKAWAKNCTEERVLPGGTKEILRWFCPPEDEL